MVHNNLTLIVYITVHTSINDTHQYAIEEELRQRMSIPDLASEILSWECLLLSAMYSVHIYTWI